MSKPREWWIDSIPVDMPYTQYAYMNIPGEGDHDGRTITRVIEHSAYLELMKQAEAMAEALDAMNMKPLPGVDPVQKSFIAVAKKALSSWQAFKEKL